MAEVALLVKARGAKISADAIGVIELDATVNETHRTEVDATQHPVERGAPIVDHLRLQPEEVSIEGLISNTPITRDQQSRAIALAGGSFQSVVAGTSFGAPGYAEEAFARLRSIQEQGFLVTVATHFKSYTDMALISLTVPRDARTGDALRFSATFRRIRIVENRSTLIAPATNPRANRRVKSGRQALREIKHDAKVIRKVGAPWIDPILEAGANVGDSLGKLKMPDLLQNAAVSLGI